MAKKKAARTTLEISVNFDPAQTDPEGLATALDKLLETACSTPGILDEYGNPDFDEFFVALPHVPVTRIRQMLESANTEEKLSQQRFGSSDYRTHVAYGKAAVLRELLRWANEPLT